jgi:hypothetical protein
MHPINRPLFLRRSRRREALITVALWLFSTLVVACLFLMIGLYINPELVF